METKRLTLPYVSQNGAGASYGRGDCGISQVVALARALGNPISVDDAGRLIGLPPGYTSAHITSHLQALAARLGITLEHRGHLQAEDLRRELRNNRSVIVLVWYPSLEKRRLADYRDNHFITVHGFRGSTFYYDDPEWFSPSDGEDIAIHETALLRAMNEARAATPAQGLLLRSHTLPEWVPEPPAPTEPADFWAKLAWAYENLVMPRFEQEGRGDITDHIRRTVYAEAIARRDAA